MRSLTHGVHWQSPTLIILAFIAGLAFACSHHAFYQDLHGQPVNSHLFSQQTNLAAGHAFAFLVRACLCIAIGASYWQVFWGTVLRGTFALSHVDAFAGFLGSIIDMMNVKALVNRPALVVLALLSWLIPLASILPPATLSVQITNETLLAYPHPYVPHFNDTAMAAASNDQYNAGGVEADANGNRVEGPSPAAGVMSRFYSKPTRQLSRLVTSTAFRGAVPLHKTTHPNSTYRVDFLGPAMQCQPTSQDVLKDFNATGNCDLLSRNTTGCNSPISYISWTPNLSELVPYKNDNLTLGYLPLDPSVSSTYDSRYLGGYWPGPPAVFVATRSQQPTDTKIWDVLNCSMYNASYTVGVTSDGDSQSVPSVLGTRELNNIEFRGFTSGSELFTQLDPTKSAFLGYLALMECINRLLVGTIFGSAGQFQNGSIYYNERNLATQNEAFSQTLLPFAYELLPFLGHVTDMSGYRALAPEDEQWTVIGTLFGEDGDTILSFPTEAYNARSTFNRTLGRVIEELFQNMTLSLFSNELFLAPATENITVTYVRTQNTYAYSSKNLLLSYGLALGFALIAVVAGCASIIYNGASYSNRFSTILRTTRGQNLEELIMLNDRKGADPLPKYLAKTHIRLGGEELSQQSDEESQIQLQQKAGAVDEETAMMGSQQHDDPLRADFERRASIVSERSVVRHSHEDNSDVSEASMRSQDDEDNVSEVSPQEQRDARERRAVNDHGVGEQE